MAVQELFRANKRESTVDIVVNNIKKLLIERKLKPGDRLPNEVEISEAMNVSRGSVREALRILTAFGLVESRVGTGTYICQKPGRTLADSLLFSFFVNNPNIGKLYEFRRLIVIETGTGNCHIFVDESADFDMAIDIIFNAKTQRIGVCNACESLVIHEKIVDAFLPRLKACLDEKHVQMRGDEKACAAAEGLVKATEEDWGREYLDYILSVKTVKNIDEAIAHINRYNTGHSEAIVTKDYANAQKFLNEIDAAAVYVNASTRFTDGYEFGFGAEIGISTQKLHARGPMGLDALTSGKYIIYGNGQIR